MRLESIEEKYPNCMIEVTDDNKAFIHVGGAYPLILNIDTPDPAPTRRPEPPAPTRSRLPRCYFCGKYAGVIYTDLEGHQADPTDCEAVIACFGCADSQSSGPVSENVAESGYNLWHNPGYTLCWWVSDGEGYELASFKTEAEARAWMAEGIEQPERARQQDKEVNSMY